MQVTMSAKGQKRFWIVDGRNVTLGQQQTSKPFGSTSVLQS